MRGIVEDTGSDVHGVAAGDLVIAPFAFGDGTCANCAAGWPSNCIHGGSFGNHGIDGGQGEAVRVPLAETTLVKVPTRGLRRDGRTPGHQSPRPGGIPVTTRPTHPCHLLQELAR